jgi:hypothetical protein
METGTEQKRAKKRPPPAHAFKPGQSGNPAGRPALTPEERLQRRVQARVIKDVAQEMRQHAEAAIEALRDVIERGDEQAVIGAAKVVLSYAYGPPVQMVESKISFEQSADRISAEDIRRAALSVAGRYAETVG